MKLSLEIPTSMLQDIWPLTDFHFTLAQRAVDEDYAAFYRAYPNYLHIMDNGFHEKGLRAMSPVELLDAAQILRPGYVISPDVLKDAKATWDNYAQFKRVFQGLPYAHAFVLQWGDLNELHFLLEALKAETNIGMLCLPYRLNRLHAFIEALHFLGTDRYKWPGNGRIHLLGMNEVAELVAFRKLFEDMQWPEDNLTMDTAKPIKWGLKGHLIEDLGPYIHGGGLVNLDLRDWQHHRAEIYRNIAFIRKHL